MSENLPPAERLLNLVIALVNTTGRMTKEQIRAQVAGYDDAASVDAFERMFERDKETLRDLGVPVVTVTDVAHGDDQGYRVDTDAYALPPMELTSAQLGVLALAAEFWQGQVLRSDAARALTKLRVVGATPSATDAVAGLAPRLHPAGPALGPLLDAAHERRVVTFTYRTASTGEVRRRTVEPWRVIGSRGGWYLVGHDRDRAAPRVFRLSRIEGAVRPTGEPGAFTVPDDVDPRAMVTSAQRDEGRTAWLAIAPDRAGALRSRGLVDPGPPPGDLPAPPAGTDVVAVPYTRTAELADEVTGYTDAVVVLGPATLRDAVVRRLEAAVAMAARVEEVARG
ncbi:WYL domain-containing protein [Cellulomonas sp. APG4]|uniref:helix-turn-helix transcriptional regulator n=1 Tax=Cellulomonas sp. APG4 TaxID=1538656 RepID=UPI001379BC28|nr:WYL domain-containing protein [Cellulomonas sp. APG4]NCT90717.1 WYL domain-containing protein [Cellulomonas sp. APG4]